MKSMNYYNPNLYQNYPFGNGNNQYFQPYNQVSQPPQQMMQQMTPQYLNGKVVDTIDMVKATEVPIGGYGIFPKADLSEIYIKSWNQNGTTSISTFKPFIPQEIEKEKQNTEIGTTAVLEKIEQLEEKINTVLGQITAAPKPAEKKEVIDLRKEF